LEQVDGAEPCPVGLATTSVRIEMIIDHAGAITLADPPSDGRRDRTEAFILLVTVSAG
jgi:hypothetical protein